MAGSCRIGSYGAGSVETCTNGYTRYTDSRGHGHSYGIRNGGFDRYPNSGVPSYAVRRSW